MKDGVHEKKFLEILFDLFIDYGIFDRMYCYSDTDFCLVISQYS